MKYIFHELNSRISEISSTQSDQNIMNTLHWSFDSSVQHVCWCNKVGFLIKCFLLVRSTSGLCIFPIHGRKDISDFEWEMIMGARRANSGISEISDFLVFFPARLSRVFKELHLRQKKKNSSEKWNCRRKFLVNNRAARWRTCTVRSNSRAVTQQIVERYNSDISVRSGHKIKLGKTKLSHIQFCFKTMNYL